MKSHGCPSYSERHCNGLYVYASYFILQITIGYLVRRCLSGVCYINQLTKSLSFLLSSCVFS